MQDTVILLPISESKHAKQQDPNRWRVTSA